MPGTTTPTVERPVRTTVRRPGDDIRRLREQIAAGEWDARGWEI